MTRWERVVWRLRGHKRLVQTGPGSYLVDVDDLYRVTWQDRFVDHVRTTRWRLRAARHRLRRWWRRRRMTPTERRLTDYLEGGLAAGLREAEDQQILYGNGTDAPPPGG